jgi:hypothetical protein
MLPATQTKLGDCSRLDDNILKVICDDSNGSLVFAS